MVQELNTAEIGEVAGGPLFGLLVIPAVKIGATVKATLIGGGIAAGVAGATLASQNGSDDKN